MAEYVSPLPKREDLIKEAASKMAAHDLEQNDYQEPLDFYEGMAEIAAKVFLP